MIFNRLPEVPNCCFCLSLKVGCIIITLYSFFSAALTHYYVYSELAEMNNDYHDDRDDCTAHIHDEDCVQHKAATIGVLGILLAADLVRALVSVAFLIGIFLKKIITATIFLYTYAVTELPNIVLTIFFLAAGTFSECKSSGTSKAMCITTLAIALIGTRAAAAFQTKHLQSLTSTFIPQLLPHLLNDPHSLWPAYHMRVERKTFADVVIGIPTVKRDKENYLMITLTHLIDGLTEEDLNTTLIVVMVGETDLEYVLNTARQIETMFPKHVESGLIELISPPASYYPDFDSLPLTLGDSQKRVKWRTKQNLDTIYLMAYAQGCGTFYLMLEDDVIAKKRYMQDIKTFTATTSLTTPNWFFIQYCQVGGIGKLFRSSDLVNFITYVQLFFNNMPIDWLLESYLADRVCTTDKTSKACVANKVLIRPKYKTSLFQHIGLYSSLKGKIQKIKDSHLGTVPTFYPHSNPPVESVTTTIEDHSGHTLRRAYDGQTYFWGVKPKKGATIEFNFEKPTLIERYTFRSGNVEHVSDKIQDCIVEVLPVNGNFTQIDSFDEFGMADGEIRKDVGPLLAVQLRFLVDSHYWVILSEIELKPPEPEAR